MHLPDLIHTDDPQLNAWIRDIVECVRALKIQESPDIRVEELPGGTAIFIKQIIAAATAPSDLASISAIWKPYVSTEEATDHPSWWRTILITQGTVNAQHPQGDGTAGGPYGDDSALAGLTGDDLQAALDNSSIEMDAGATWHFYLKCTISTALDATEGTVTKVEIFAGTSWWPGYPAQPNGDSSTGAPADAFYIPLFDITTSADPDYSGDGPYPAGTLTMPTPGTWSDNSWWLDLVEFGQPTHDETGKCITQQRMSQGAI